MRAEVYRVSGRGIAVFGDLHLSSTYTGQHRDYTLECYNNMNNIERKVKDMNPCAVVFLGDVIGVNERNLRDRRFLMRVFLFFKTLNELTGGNVYSVRGNHDIGDFSDFDFLIGTGMLKNPKYVDFYGKNADGSENFEVRFHFINYGEEEADLDICREEGVSNVGLGHNDFIAEGITNWYQHKGGVSLAKRTNFEGIDILLSGHIHDPSEEVSSALVGGKTLDFFYLGSPSRTAERFNDCWWVRFDYILEDGGYVTEYSAEEFGLEPAGKVFYPKEDFIGEEDISEEERKKSSESLTNIVKEIMEGRISGGDLFAQVRAVPNASNKVKDIACDYLHRAIDMKG